ncbi:MAG: hypothetical protein WA159_21045 [Variovorax sp.]
MMWFIAAVFGIGVLVWAARAPDPMRVDPSIAIDASEPSSPPAPTPTTAVPSAQPSREPSSQPLWLRARRPDVGTADRSRETKPPADRRDARFGVALERLGELSNQPDPDPVAVAEVIDLLEQANGSPVMNGVRLDVLRENLLVSKQITVIAKEIQAGVETSGRKMSSEQQGPLADKVRALEALRARLRTDVLEKPATP